MPLEPPHSLREVLECSLVKREAYAMDEVHADDERRGQGSNMRVMEGLSAGA